jgi:D-alanyl-D-alanine carboxypeptidase
MILARGFWVAAALCILAVTSQAASTPRSKPSRPAAADDSKAYKGVVVMNVADGSVLFEDRASTVSPPASMTKLMTFAVLHDLILRGQLTLQTPVTVSAPDSKIGGTQVWLKEGEVFPLEELLYAMLIQSANDAAYAMARTAAGSVPAFVELMNAKAQELGMTQTIFRTPHGLPPSNRRIDEGDVTTAHDYALLCRHLLRSTDVLKYTSVKTRPFGPPLRSEAVEMNNHNHLLGKVAGVDGLKTGFTNGAGYCLSATAQRNGRRLVVVILGSPDSRSRDLKVGELLERGFAALPAVPPSPSQSTADSPITRAPAPTPAAAPTPPPSNSTPAIKFKFSVPKKK